MPLSIGDGYCIAQRVTVAVDKSVEFAVGQPFCNRQLERKPFDLTIGLEPFVGCGRSTANSRSLHLSDVKRIAVCEHLSDVKRIAVCEHLSDDKWIPIREHLTQLEPVSYSDTGPHHGAAGMHDRRNGGRRHHQRYVRRRRDLRRFW